MDNTKIKHIDTSSASIFHIQAILGGGSGNHYDVFCNYNLGFPTILCKCI